MRGPILIALYLVAPAAAQERRLPESELHELLRAAASKALGPEIGIGAIHQRGDLVVRGTEVSVEVERPATLRAPGRVALRATLRTPLEQRPIAFSAELISTARAAGVRRGTSVLLVARSGAVTVSAGGQAQQDGAVGERVHVLCPALHRVLVGRVIDPSTVEIEIGGK